jgi:hypothetical protein
MEPGSESDWTQQDAVHELAAFMRNAGVSPARVHAFEVCGYIINEDNADEAGYTPEEVARWHEALAEGERLYGTEG